MLVIFQLIIIFLAGLIAYWWANQGLMSSILHFVAVVCAGAIALAFWEPLVVGVVLDNRGTDNYAWGFILVALFVVSLFIIRFAFDRLAPANVQIPHWANLVFGGIFGVGSGTITVGILMIAIGFTQSSNEVMGFHGAKRTNLGITVEETAWFPAHTLTARFYEFLSAGAFYPEFSAQPLKQVNPKLDEQAFSLIRDTYRQGTGKTSIAPDAVTVLKVHQATGSGPTEQGRVFVDVKVNNEGFDHADQFIMSVSQIRLLAYQGGDVRRGAVSIASPDRWSQNVRVGGTNQVSTYRFDDVSHFVTSVPGQNEVTFQVEFAIGNSDRQIAPGAIPKYIQIKGVRYALPAIEQASTATTVRGRFDRGAPDVLDNPNAPMANATDIEQRFDLRPINSASKNNSIGFTKNYEGKRSTFVEGEQTFHKGARAPGRETRIHGIYAAPGTAIVRVNLSRDAVTSMYGAAREKAGESATPMLVDSEGNTYRAKGYLLATPEEYHLKIDPDNLISSISELPALPTSDVNKLWLIFQVTDNAHLVSFRFDDVTVAQCNVQVVPF
ncbi:MAG: CvpA family protein [Phycisphaerales bacterium]